MQDRQMNGVAKVIDVNQRKDEDLKSIETALVPSIDMYTSNDIVEENCDGDDANTSTIDEVEFHLNEATIKEARKSVKLERSNMEDLSISSDFDDGEIMGLNDRKESMYEKQDKVWVCKECGKLAKQRCHIKNHVETHIEGISEECNICGKSYKSKSVLSAHMTKHNKKKLACLLNKMI